MPYRVPAALDLSDAERVELEGWARRRKTAQALALRSRIVLRAAAGLNNTAVAAELEVSKRTIGKWREHRSVADLERDVCAFIDATNADPKPFHWVRSADDILVSVKRFCPRTLYANAAAESPAPGG